MRFEDALLKMNLQLFAEESGEDEGTDPEGPKDMAESEQGENEGDPEKKYTDDDVNGIVKKKIAEERKKAEKAVKEAEKLAKMNEEQKKEYELEQLRIEVAELKAKENKHEMSKIARVMLADENISVNDELLSFLVTDEAESTKQNVEDFKKEFKSAVDVTVMERLRGKTPSASGGNAPNADSRKLTEMTYEEQLELQTRDPELYSKKLSEI